MVKAGMKFDLFYKLIYHLVFNYLLLLDLFYGCNKASVVVP